MQIVKYRCLRTACAERQPDGKPYTWVSRLPVGRKPKKCPLCQNTRIEEVK